MSQERAERIVNFCHGLQEDYEIFKKNLNLMRKQHGEIFEEFLDKNPKFTEALDKVEAALDILNNQPGLTPEILMQRIDQYNESTDFINHFITQQILRSYGIRTEYVERMMRGEIPFNEDFLTEEKKRTQIFRRKFSE